jgi:hypothetical protein
VTTVDTVAAVEAALIITGGVLQGVGLALVIVEVLVIRSYEFGVPTPWARLVRWVRRLLKRPQLVNVGAALSGSAAMSGRAVVRPGPVDPTASDSERITRLESYVERINQDLEAVHRLIDRKDSELREAMVEADDRVRAEMQQRDTQRKEQLRPSLVRQSLGATCIVIGLALATTGSVMAL